MSDIEHTEDCVWDHVVWGECIHGAGGERIDNAQVVKYSGELEPRITKLRQNGKTRTLLARLGIVDDLQPYG